MIVSLSKVMVFSPAFDRTIPMYRRDSGVTRLPIYVRVLVAKLGTGILITKNTRAIKNPTSGAGRSFFQSNLLAPSFLPVLLSLVIR